MGQITNSLTLYDRSLNICLNVGGDGKGGLIGPGGLNRPLTCDWLVARSVVSL